MDERTRKTLRHATTYASERLTTTGYLKEDHGPRPITLPTLESKRKFDQEVFGEDGERAIRDRDQGARGDLEQ